MIWILSFVLFAGPGLELPRLGYLPSEDGRLYPLYGMRGTFLLGDPLPKGKAPVAPAQLQPSVRSLVREGGRQWLLDRTAKGEPIRTALDAERRYGLDSKDRLWWADRDQLSCGDRQWTIPAPAQSLLTLNDGWMAIRTSTVDYAARCDESELFLLPRPE